MVVVAPLVLLLTLGVVRSIRVTLLAAREPEAEPQPDRVDVCAERCPHLQLQSSVGSVVCDLRRRRVTTHPDPSV